MRNAVLDFRFALRMLYRKPGFTAVAVAALAIGIGANTAVFTVVNGVLLRPLALPGPDRLFLVSYVPRDWPAYISPGLFDRHYLEFRQQDRMFEALATFGYSDVSLTGAGEAVRVPAVNVTADFFKVLGLQAARGRTFVPGEDQPGRSRVAVLSDKLWRSRFHADPRVLGRTIQLDGEAYTVIGVMPPGLKIPGNGDLWTPLEIRIQPRNTMSRTVIGRLKPGVTPRQASQELGALGARLQLFPGMEKAGMRAEILPLRELFVASFRTSLVMFMGAVGFVLLIACANVANLFLARAIGRHQETAMRSALGASRWRLMRQLLAESTVVSLMGGAVGTLLALWGVPALLALAPPGTIPRMDEIHIDGVVLAVTLGVSVLTGIGFGLAPAVQATRRELRDWLSQASRTVTSRHERLRSGLVVAEIALTLVLLASAGLMLKSFIRMRAVNPGFRAENALMVTVETPDSQHPDTARARAFHQTVLERLTALRGVQAAGAVSFSPIVGTWLRGDIHVEGGRTLPPDLNPYKPVVTPGYFRAMGIELLKGRDFTDRDTASSEGVAIVSQSVARQVWPGEDPIGKRISNVDDPKAQDWLTVVGVVNDIRQQAVTQEPEEAVYQCYRQAGNPLSLAQMTFVLRTAADPAALDPAVRAALREIDPDQPALMVATMTDLISGNEAEPLFQTRLLGVFSGLALILAAVGIYGVLAYAVTERTREIGIRVALGAQAGTVLGMVLRRTLALTAAGVVLGLAGSLAATRVLAKFLFEVKPADPETLILTIALLGAVALAAGWIPARRAVRVDPAVALRYE